MEINGKLSKTDSAKAYLSENMLKVIEKEPDNCYMVQYFHRGNLGYTNLRRNLQQFKIGAEQARALLDNVNDEISRIHNDFKIQTPLFECVCDNVNFTVARRKKPRENHGVVHIIDQVFLAKKK